MNTPTPYSLGFVRMMDLLQERADKYVKTTLVTNVKKFINLYFPSQGTDTLVNQIISDSASKGLVNVFKPTTTEYVCATSIGFLTRPADYGYIQ